MARRPGRRQDHAIRDALITYRDKFARRWDTPSARERAARTAAGAEIRTDSDELLTALLPVDQAAAMQFARVGMKAQRYVLTENDELQIHPDDDSR